MTEFKVKVIKEYDGIPEGSVFCVQKETKTFYKGLWPCGPCTCNVSVPKKNCEVLEE